MKNRIVYLFAICLLIIGIWFVWLHKHISAIQQNATSSTVETNIAKSIISNSLPARIQLNGSQTNQLWDPNHLTGEQVTNMLLAYAKRMQAQEWQWKMPIDFYGKVIDENNNSVTNATASFEWNDLSPTGTSRDSTTSDVNGFFLLLGRTGKILSVTVSKDGYYTTPSERSRTFEYAYPPGGAFKPDSNNPVVFHLRKKGVGVNLITSKYGIRPDFPVHIPRDGTPIKINFLQREAGNNGQMQITEIKPEYANWKQATSWSFKMEIPDGGFVEESDEFPFEAPESGYQPVVEFNFQQGQVDWTTDVRKDYYIKFGNPPQYGHLYLNTSIDMGGAILTYAINPDGSRNLEPK